MKCAGFLVLIFHFIHLIFTVLYLSVVALSYSIQITENERIAVTPYDVPVDALVFPSGFIPISPVAFEKCL